MLSYLYFSRPKTKKFPRLETRVLSGLKIKKTIVNKIRTCLIFVYDKVYRKAPVRYALFISTPE